MKCPTCATVDLMMSERQGIEIDYCPTCRGVWLDRGELDKIIERSNPALGSQPTAAPPVLAHPVTLPNPAPRPFFGHRDHDEHDEHDGHSDHNGYGKHGKRSFLRDLFD